MIDFVGMAKFLAMQGVWAGASWRVWQVGAGGVASALTHRSAAE